MLLWRLLLVGVGEFPGGEFSTGEVGKFKPALTVTSLTDPTRAPTVCPRLQIPPDLAPAFATNGGFSPLFLPDKTPGVHRSANLNSVRLHSEAFQRIGSPHRPVQLSAYHLLWQARARGSPLGRL